MAKSSGSGKGDQNGRDDGRGKDADGSGKPTGPVEAKPGDLIAACNHTLRRQVLRRLAGAEEPRSPASLAGELFAGLSVVSYHMSALYRRGAVVRVDEHQVRGAMEHFYVTNVGGNEMVKLMLRETEAEDGDRWAGSGQEGGGKRRSPRRP